MVIFTPGIYALSLNNRMVAISFWLKCTVTGKSFRAPFLSKLFIPPFVDTVIFLRFLHALIYFTKSVLFETLFVKHVSSINHVCLMSAQRCIRITPTCTRFFQSDLYIAPIHGRFSGMSSILFPHVGSRYVLVPPLDLYHFRVLLCRCVLHVLKRKNFHLFRCFLYGNQISRALFLPMQICRDVLTRSL